MVAKSHYDIEDTIQTDSNREIMQTLESGLATNRARASQHVVNINKHLAPTKAKIKEIKQFSEDYELDILMGYCNFMLGAIEDISKRVVALFRIVEQNGSLFTEANTIIKTYEQQIDNIALELEEMLEAIQDGDTGNSRLKPLVRVIRDEIEAEAIKQGYDNALYDNINDIAHHIRYHNLEGHEETAYRIASLVAGTAKHPTAAEINSFKQLVAAVNARTRADT